MAKVKNPYEVRVKEVLSKEVVSIDANATVHEALVLLAENKVSALPVVDRREVCVGLVSTTDIIGLTRDLDDELNDLGRVAPESHQWLIDMLSEHDLARRPVTEIMTEQVATVRPENLLIDAAREMLRQRVHRLPVVDDHKRLLGIISTTDIVRAFVEGAPPV